MRFGRVLGRVVLSKSLDSLKGARWLAVQPLAAADFHDLSRPSAGGEPGCVVYDSLGARTGDIIGFTEGGEASRPFSQPTPVDAYNALIVERIHLPRREKSGKQLIEH